MANTPPSDVLQEEGRTRGSSEVPYRLSRGCSSSGVWLQNASYTIMNHFLWKSLIALFTILLLFGPTCQIWFIPVRGNLTMNILYFLGFVIFVMDMIFRCYVDPKYFVHLSCDRMDGRNKANACTGRGLHLIGYVGSFSFWCDFVSTICFLLEMDIIYKHRFDSIKNVIILNQYGFPVSTRYGWKWANHILEVLVFGIRCTYKQSALKTSKMWLLKLVNHLI